MRSIRQKSLFCAIRSAKPRSYRPTPIEIWFLISLTQDSYLLESSPHLKVNLSWDPFTTNVNYCFSYFSISSKCIKSKSSTPSKFSFSSFLYILNSLLSKVQYLGVNLYFMTHEKPFSHKFLSTLFIRSRPDSFEFLGLNTLIWCINMNSLFALSPSSSSPWWSTGTTIWLCLAMGTWVPERIDPEACFIYLFILYSIPFSHLWFNI